MKIEIPFYNILNMFLTGIVFIGGCLLIFPHIFIGILNSDIMKDIKIGPEIVIVVCVFAVMYEVGLIVNRVGSVVIEPILKKIKVIQLNDDYILFNDKKKEYPIMDTLSREYSLSRTGVSLFLLLSLLSILERNCWLALGYTVIMIIYGFSCHKFSKKIGQLMK